MKDFGTVIPAMVTPFTPDLGVDYDRAARLAARLVDMGCDGVLVCGTTGESPTLTEEEKVKLFETVVKAVGDRVFVWAGTGSNNTVASIRLTQRAEAAGVDGVMLVTPYYNKPPQEGLYQHFAAVAAATRLPVMLYNVPGRTSRNIEADTVARLAAVENIVAIKEASGDLDQVSQIRSLTPPDFIIYSGDDSLTLPIMAVGGRGIVSVAAHVVGGDLRAMVRAFAEGDALEARSIHRRLMPVFKAMFVTTNPIPVKTALNLVGFNVGGFRLPLVAATEMETNKIRVALEQAGLL